MALKKKTTKTKAKRANRQTNMGKKRKTQLNSKGTTKSDQELFKVVTED